MTGVSGNSQQFNDPSFLANQPQQQVDDQKTVTTGPGGSTGAPIVSIGDMITRFVGPSNQGMTGSSKDLGIGSNINASDPSLQIPDTAPFSVSLGMLSSFINSIMTPNDTTVPTDDFGFNAGGGAEPVTTNGPSLAVPTDLSSKDKSTVLKALLAFTGVTSNPALTLEQKAAFINILDEMAQKIATQNAGVPDPALTSGDAAKISTYLTGLVSAPGMSHDDLALFQSSLTGAATAITANAYTNDLQSKDPKAVLATLMSFTGVDKDPSLTDAQKTSFTAKLTELATNIATQNASGKPDPVLSTLDDKALSVYLLARVDVSTLPPADQTRFTATINEAASEIGSINAASLKQPEKTPLMTGMQSKEPATVLDSMKTMLTAQNMTAAQITELTPKLTDLANIIAQKNGSPEGSGLDITDADTLKQSLIALLGAGNDVANADLQTAIGAIATAFAAENTTFYTMLSKSTDQTVVFDALRHLSNIDHNPNLTPAERQAGLSYLALMATALAFMSTVRAKISMLEADIRKNESAGKLATIKDQSRAAELTFKNGIEKIGKDLQKALDAIFMKALMAILGPIILVILAIITAILSIVGCSAVGAALMICVIVVMTVIAIADMQTGMFDKLGKMCSSEKAGQEAASFGFQAIIMAIMIVFTLGAASFVCAAQIAAKAAAKGMEIGMKVAIQQGLSMVKDQISQSAKKVVQFIIGQVISLLMSSGLLTDGFVKMFKAMGMSDKDADTAAMIMTIVLMLVMMGAMAKSAGSSLKGVGAAGAGAAKEGVKDTVKIELEEVVKKSVSFAKGTKEGADDAAEALGGVAGVVGSTTTIAAEEAQQMLTNVLKNLAKKLTELTGISTNPNAILLFLQAFAGVAQAGATIGQAIGSFNQAKLSEAQATLTLAAAESQAIIDILKQLAPTFDMTQQDLDNSSKDFMQGYTELMNLFANMVSSASAIVSTTTQTS